MNEKTRVIEGRADIKDIANTLSLIISKGYNPSSASDLVRIAFLVLGNEASRQEAVTFKITEDALQYLRDNGMNKQKSRVARSDAALLKQLQFENISFETKEDEIEEAMKELKGGE